MNRAMQRVEADLAVSISEVKKSPSAVLGAADGRPVAILSHNRVVAYMVPASAYEQMLERLEDAELNAIAEARRDDPVVRVALDEL